MINEPSTSSGQIATTTATVISSKPALLWSVVLNPGSAASSVTVYDNATAASGTILAELLGVANGASIVWTNNSPISAENGLTVAVAGTAATATLSYSKNA